MIEKKMRGGGGGEEDDNRICENKIECFIIHESYM